MYRLEGKHLKFFIITLVLVFSIALPSFAVEQNTSSDTESAQLVASTTQNKTTSTKATTEQGQNKEQKKPQQKDFFNPDDTSTTSTNETVETKSGFMEEIQPLIQQYGLYAGIGIVVLIILIIVIVKVIGGGGKNKATCTQCGASVLPGMNYCSSCSNKNIISDMEGMAGEMPIYSQEPTSSSASDNRRPEVKKKIRPSGRVIATVTIRKGLNAGYKFSFYDSQTQMSIGKAPECDLVLEDDEDRDISPRHAVISMADGNIFTIHDMSNSVGILVNSEKVNKSSLKSGDVIKISKTELTFARL